MEGGSDATVVKVGGLPMHRRTSKSTSLAETKLYSRKSDGSARAEVTSSPIALTRARLWSIGQKRNVHSSNIATDSRGILDLHPSRQSVRKAWIVIGAEGCHERLPDFP